MADPRTDLTPGTLFGGYRIDSYVARGGMGVIYQATQLTLQRTVALKLVAPELAYEESFRERFKREAQLAASLDHPNILPVYEAGEIDGQLFLAMRFVVGTDLDSLIRRERALAPERAIRIIEQVAAALDAAHGRGLVHRDVKPGNILIAEEYGEERAYLTDFGLTKSTATAANLTRTGQMVGTLDYVAPEQVQGGTVDGRVDTYALACVLYQAVTGAIPFDRPSDVAKMMAHVMDPPPSAAAVAPTVSPELDAVIRRGMAKKPEDRYGSSGEFARAARAAAAVAAGPGGAGQSEPTAVGVPAPGKIAAEPPRQGLLSGRRPIYLGGAVAVLIIAVIIVVAVGGGGGGGGTTTISTVATTISTSASTATGTSSAAPLTTVSTSTSRATDPAAAYHAQIARINPRIHAAFNQLPNGNQFGTPAFGQAVLALAASLETIAGNVQKLSPPAALVSDHQALVTRIDQLAQDFRSLAADSNNRNFSGAQNDLQATKTALSEIDSSVRKLLAGS